MTRVGQEVDRVSPTDGHEFLLVRTEVLAGRDCEQALRDMAERMDIEEARSFENVVTQSLQYGSSVSDALQVYAVEMRETRELQAQGKANRLPVQMSAVMASLKLPALFMITLGPTVIRYIRFSLKPGYSPASGYTASGRVRAEVADPVTLITPARERPGGLRQVARTTSGWMKHTSM